jgi:hypothetical protein
MDKDITILFIKNLDILTEYQVFTFFNLTHISVFLDIRLLFINRISIYLDIKKIQKFACHLSWVLVSFFGAKNLPKVTFFFLKEILYRK